MAGGLIWYLRGLGVLLIEPVVLFALVLVLVVVLLQLLPHGVDVVLLHQLVLREEKESHHQSQSYANKLNTGWTLMGTFTS